MKREIFYFKYQITLTVLLIKLYELIIGCIDSK